MKHVSNSCPTAFYSGRILGDALHERLVCNQNQCEWQFGQVLVNSCLTISLVTGMSVSDISQKTIANLGWDKVRLSGPVFIGDTLYAESTVLSIRESKSRPNQGIVTVESVGKKQDGSQVISFERSMLIPKRGFAIDDEVDY